jgi:hypothetical protein
MLILKLLFAFSLHAQPVPEPEVLLPDQAKPETLKTIEVDWDEVENTTGYEVKLTPATGEKPLFFSTKENHLTRKVPLGTYTLQIRARETDEASPWSAPTTLEVAIKEIQPLNPEDGSTINAEGKDKQVVEFKWSPVDKIKIYTLKVWSESRRENPWVFTGKTTAKKIEVPPGEVYHWQVSFESADDVSYAQEPRIFSFVLQGTKLLRPEIDAKISKTNPKSLSWTAPADAKEYDAKLFYRYLDETEWKLVREETLTTNSWAMQKLRPGAYKVEVVAHAPRRLSSEKAELEFVIKPTASDLELALRGAVSSVHK